MMFAWRHAAELRHVSELRHLLLAHMRDARDHREQCRDRCCPATRVVATFVELYAFKVAIAERRVTS